MLSGWVGPCVEGAFRLLLDVSLRAAVTLVLASAAAALLIRLPARTRHALWGACLIGVLGLPLLALVLPPWTVAVPFLDAPSPRATVVAAAPRPAPERLAPAPERLAPAPERLAPDSAPGSPGREKTPTALALDPLPGLVAEPASGPALVTSTWSWHEALAGLWLAGVGFFLLGYGVDLVRLTRLSRRARPVEDRAWLELLDACRREIGVARRVRLLMDPRTLCPMTWGSLRPKILLPASARRWSMERRRVVLLHELAHVDRFDWALALLGHAAAVLYWINPLVWRARSRLLAEQELACDEAVLRLGVRASDYAQHLLDIAKTLSSPSHSLVPALEMARGPHLEGRLMALLNTPHRPHGRRSWLVPTLTSMLAVVALVAMLSPVAAAPVVSTSPDAVQADAPPLETSTPGRDISAVMDDLEALEQRLEPFEQRLEAIATDLEPREEELARIEEGSEPAEAELERIEADLEPFEQRLQAFEAEMEPFEQQLRAIEVDFEPFEGQLEALEAELEPFMEQLEAIEADHREMRPARERAERVHREMRPIHERIERVHREMRPAYERIERVHREMRPIHERMATVHEEMRPIHERIERVHREREPAYRAMEEIHREMEPTFRRMEEIHREMEPIHREMETLHREMDESLRREVTGLLERELASVLAPGTQLSAVAREILGHGWTVDDGRGIELRASESAIHQALAGLPMAADSAAAQSAIERATSAVAGLVIQRP